MSDCIHCLKSKPVRHQLVPIWVRHKGRLQQASLHLRVPEGVDRIKQVTLLVDTPFYDKPLRVDALTAWRNGWPIIPKKE